MTTYYKFIPCNGKEPEFSGDPRLSIIDNYGLLNTLLWQDGKWHYFNPTLRPDIVTNWNHISILTEVHGVVMNREDVGKVWDAAIKYQQDEYDNHEHGLRILAPDKQTTLNNLFSNNKTV